MRSSSPHHHARWMGNKDTFQVALLNRVHQFYKLTGGLVEEERTLNQLKKKV